MNDLSPNTMIDLNIWNSVIDDVAFPQYQWFWRTSFRNGGVIDAYRIAGNSFVLGSIEDNITRYNEYRDIRSNYMYRDFSATAGTWNLVDSYTSGLNNYNFAQQTARLSANRSAGTITTLSTSIYLVYVDLIINSVASHSYADIRLLKNGVEVACSYESLPNTGHSAYIHTSAISLYENADYQVEFRLGGNGDVSVRLGYTEFIGNKNGCGEFS